MLARAARSAAETRRPVVSDLFIGTVAQSLVLAVNVPMLRDGEPVYVINSTLAPQRILSVLAQREVPPGFVSAVFDGSYRLIARSIDHEKYLGSNARPDFRRVATDAEGAWVGINRNGESVSGADMRTKLANWMVGVTVPTAVLEAPFRRSLLFIVALGAIGLAASVVLAARARRPSSRSARARSAANGCSSSATTVPVWQLKVHELWVAHMDASRDGERRLFDLTAMSDMRHLRLAVLGCLRWPLG